MCLSLFQLANRLKNIPCGLFIYVSHCCVYNGSSVIVVPTVNVDSESFIFTLLFYGG